MRLLNAARSAISFSIGVYITFSQSHSAEVGLLALAIFGLTLGIGTAVLSLWKLKGFAAIEGLPLSVLAVLIGLFALLAPAQTSTATLEQAFISLVTAWGLLAGALELYQARRRGFRTPGGRDALLNSLFSLLIGALFLVAQLDIVSAVGFFGIYLAMSGVHLGIAAASPQKTAK